MGCFKLLIGLCHEIEGLIKNSGRDSVEIRGRFIGSVGKIDEIKGGWWYEV